jgi:hypothetical protein
MSDVISLAYTFGLETVILAVPMIDAPSRVELLREEVNFSQLRCVDFLSCFVVKACNEYRHNVHQD